MPRIEVNVFQAEATATMIGLPQQERTLHAQVWCLEHHVQEETLGRSLHGDLSRPRSLGFILSVVKKPQAFQWGMVEVTQEIHVFKDCTGLIYGDKLVERNSRSITQLNVCNLMKSMQLRSQDHVIAHCLEIRMIQLDYFGHQLQQVGFNFIRCNINYLSELPLVFKI